MNCIAFAKNSGTHTELRESLRERNIVLPASTKKLRFSINSEVDGLLVRPKDVCMLVDTGRVSCGIVGTDMLFEYGDDLDTKPFGKQEHPIYLCAHNSSSVSNIKDIEGMNVYTSFPKIVRSALDKHAVSAQVIEVSGSTEVYCSFENSVIADVVRTGNSLRKNDCRPVQKIYSSSLALVYKDKLHKEVQAALALNQDLLKHELTVNHLEYLESILQERKNNRSNTHTSRLLQSGTRHKATQKVGEEFLEALLEISSSSDNQRVVSELADLLFHYLILLTHENLSFAEIIDELRTRK